MHWRDHEGRAPSRDRHVTSSAQASAVSGSSASNRLSRCQRWHLQLLQLAVPVLHVQNEWVPTGRVAHLVASSRLSPSRGGEDVKSLIENTSVRKAVGHSVCLLSLWIRLKQCNFAEWLMMLCVSKGEPALLRRGVKTCGYSKRVCSMCAILIRQLLFK